MLVLLVAFMYALWSSIFSLAKIALHYSPPIFLTATRMGIASVFLLIYLLITKKSIFKLSLRQLTSIALLGFFSIYLTNVLEFWALQYLSAAKACFIYSLSPFFTAFFSYLHFGEKMNGRKWIGLSLGVLGMIPIVILQTGSEEVVSAFHFLSWPSLAMIGASLASVYGWVLLRLIVKEQNTSTLVANGLSMGIGSLLALVHSFFVDSWNPIPIAAHSAIPFLGWTCLMALISNIICYNIYGMLLKKMTATFLSLMGLLSPVFASLHGWIFLGEAPSYLIFLSTLTVSLGLGIVYYTELNQGYLARKTALT